MDDPLAVALKFGFLAVLYLFLFWVARSALRDLSGQEEAAPAGGGGPRGKRRNGGGGEVRNAVDPRLEVIAAMGHDPGSTWDIGTGATMGRSDGADIRVEDPFASSAHARIFPRDDFMYIEDMGSTNGTYLNGHQLRSAERLKVADVIRIGDSEYRYRE